MDLSRFKSIYNETPLAELGWEAASRLDYLLRITNVVDNGLNAVLMYHSVGETNGSYYGNISTHVFRRQLKTLHEEFEFVDLSEVVHDNTSEKKIAVTFDDGFKNFHTNAVPILREFEIPATVFITSEFIDNGNRERIIERHSLIDVDSKVIMDSSEIRDLIDDDLITIGNHTKTHPVLSEELSRKELFDEIIGAKEELESRFGISVNRFSYPHGEHNQLSDELVRESHSLAVTGQPGVLDSSIDPYLLPRIDVVQSALALRLETTDAGQQLKSFSRRLLTE
ncbi:polysaccharide deacetylase family protein [Haladaptatus sp. CMAA 1911]|uniref:polysaccharide deacetylase family protein n=1 Tax=unclassified Haladaptatus TaxID=2622732 RepID=UPI00375534A3